MIGTEALIAKLCSHWSRNLQQHHITRHMVGCTNSYGFVSVSLFMTMYILYILFLISYILVCLFYTPWFWSWMNHVWKFIMSSFFLILTHWSLGDQDAILKIKISFLFYSYVSSNLLIIMPSYECCKTLVLISQLWFRKWLGATLILS